MYLIIFVLTLSLLYPSAAIAKNVSYNGPGDSGVKVWVFFKDKPLQKSGVVIAERGLARRLSVGFGGGDFRDLPVSKKYLQQIEAVGAKLHVVYKWENCASFYSDSSTLQKISALPFVREIRSVAVYRKNTFSSTPFLSRQLGENSMYSRSSTQLGMTSVIDAQDYLRRFRKVNAPGEGVLVALFDGGARVDHKCFSYIRKNHSVKAAWDFVQNDSLISDDDTIASNPESVHYQDDEHGSQTLGLVAGYDPGSFIGAAWGADLVLGKTENGVWDGESHSEEDNWAAAVVWAESIGVDIISSSLGYRVDFKDSISIKKNGYDTIIRDYTYNDLDGNTTIISRAASYAIQRGMVVVNAIGNEGASQPGTLGAPADVEGVISVGGVNSNGSLCSFSSTGPTSDGRIKPDLVALGSGVSVPSVYSSTHDTYTTSQGTSFSAPVISGICALIIQAHEKKIGVELVRDQLFKYCHFTPYQQAVDNYYGRGLPDALLSCMRENEVYLTVVDSLENPLVAAPIFTSDGDSLGITDSDGKALLTLSGNKLPVTAQFRQGGAGGEGDSFTISSLPSHLKIVASSVFRLAVELENRYNKAISNAVVHYKIDGMNGFAEIPADTGFAVLTGTRPLSVGIFITAPGYMKTDTVQRTFCSPACTLRIKMEDIPPEKFRIFPTVLSKRSLKTLKYEVFSQMAEAVDVSIRSVDGRLLWKDHFLADQGMIRELSFSNQLRNISPGMYFFILQMDGKAFRKKFMVTP